MSRFLFTVWPFTGCVNPQVAVARVLAARGHEIGFYTGRRFERQLSDLGFTYFPFQNLDENRVDALLLSQDAMGNNWERPWKLRPQIRDFFLDTVPQQLEDLEAIVRKWSPVAVTTDPAMWAPFLIMSERDGLPVALLSYACGCMLPGPGAPPVGLGLPLPRNWFTSAVNRLTGTFMDLFLSDMRRGASAMRRRFGLPALDGPVIGLAGRLPLYLLPSCPQFDYERRDLPESVRYVGPLQWYPPEPRQSWLDELPRDRPWIHVTEGTLHVREPFLLRAAVIGLADLPVEVIVTTGDDRTWVDLKLDKLPTNVHVRRWVSHAELLPRTSVMVTTAGGGTVMAGMSAGVPIVAVPTEWDKAENSQRIVEVGAGIRLSPSRCTPARLRETVFKILNDTSYAENARKIANHLSRQGGPERAATLIESIAVESREAAHAQSA